MEDLSVVLKKSFLEQMYKKKTETFGTVKERVEKMNEQRKNNRHDIVFEKRKIPANLTPISSPMVKLEKSEKVDKNTDKTVNKRLEMLVKWKAEKEKKKLEQKKHQKPLFKVTHVPNNVGLPNLETVNKQIKGKPFKSKFAPPDHKFKPPANIKPINFKEEKSNSENTKISRVVTRSQSRALKLKTEEIKEKKTVQRIKKSSKSEKKENDQKITGAQETNNIAVLDVREKKEKEVGRRTKKSSRSENEDHDLKIEVRKEPNNVVLKPEKITNQLLTEENEENDLQRKEIEDINDNNTVTPVKSEPPVYISPFVTVSRGKDSARKEYEARKSRKSFSTKITSDNSSPKAGAAYFTWRLNNQIDRFQQLCDHWNKYKNEENPPEEAVSMIDVAIGQTNLLMTKKFVQFRGLIDRCERGDNETPVTCEDLHGFWDMIHIQINNLDKRFENLDNMKANGWQEIIPEVHKKGPVKKKGRPPKNAKASAGLMEAIRAARKKKQNGISTDMENTEVEIERKTPQNRRTSRLVNIKSREKSHRNSSPGLMMMKVAQYAKGVETPVKSILKNDSQKSVKSQSKNVLFQDEKSQNNIGDIENNINLSNSQIKGKSPSRRSSRLIQTKLF